MLKNSYCFFSNEKQIWPYAIKKKPKTQINACISIKKSNENYKKNEVTNIGENVKKLESLCTVGGNVKWESSMELLEKT